MAEEKRERDKILDDIIADYEKGERSGAEAGKAAARDAGVENDLTVIARSVAAIAVLVACVFFSVALMNQAGFFAQKRFWAIGERRDTDFKIDGCIGNLWAVRSDADAYYASHHRFPSGLDELYGADASRKRPVCPATGAAYATKRVGESVIVCCPNPGKHGVAMLWCDIKGGPPVIERD